MKDDHQKDHLEVALQTPDGKFYQVIPSLFLWTALPLPAGRYTFIPSLTRAGKFKQKLKETATFR